MITEDLFGWAETAHYPDIPGSKRAGTSEEAAPTVSEAGRLREQVLGVLRERDMTADEVAGRLDRSVLAIRPRLSELVAKGRIRETENRRLNDSGKSAIVWTVTQPF